MISGESVLAILNDITDTITIKHGTGNILLPSGLDYAFTGNGFIWFYHDGINIQTLLVAPVPDDTKQDKVSELVITVTTVLAVIYEGRKWIICNSATPIDLTLHTAVGHTSELFIYNINTGQVTLKSNASETFNGSSSDLLIDQYESMHLKAYGGAWYVPNPLYP